MHKRLGHEIVFAVTTADDGFFRFIDEPPDGCKVPTILRAGQVEYKQKADVVS
jgi:hypothetical protein